MSTPQDSPLIELLEKQPAFAAVAQAPACPKKLNAFARLYIGNTRFGICVDAMIADKQEGVLENWLENITEVIKLFVWNHSVCVLLEELINARDPKVNVIRFVARNLLGLARLYDDELGDAAILWETVKAMAGTKDSDKLLASFFETNHDSFEIQSDTITIRDGAFKAETLADFVADIELPPQQRRAFEALLTLLAERPSELYTALRHGTIVVYRLTEILRTTPGLEKLNHKTVGAMLVSVQLAATRSQDYSDYRSALRDSLANPPQ